MATALDEVRDASEKVWRRAAESYGQAAVEYGQALAKYAKGDSDALDVARAGVNLALHQARGAWETSLALGESVYLGLASVAGIRIPARKAAPAKPTQPKASAARK